MTPTPPLIQSLDQLFVATLAAFDATRATHAALVTACGHRPDWRGVPEDCVEKEVRHLTGVVVAVAIETLSAPGSRLELEAATHIAPFEARDSYANRRRNQHAPNAAPVPWHMFRPTTLWQRIVADHPPQAIEKAAAQRAAKVITNEFRLYRNPPMKQVRGCIELEITVYLGAYCSTPQLSYQCRTNLLSLYEALVTFATHALSSEEANALRSSRGTIETLAEHNAVITSRARFPLGAGIELVTFNSVFKFYFPQPMAIALNAYLTRHADTRQYAA